MLVLLVKWQLLFCVFFSDRKMIDADCVFKTVFFTSKIYVLLQCIIQQIKKKWRKMLQTKY